MNRRRLALLIVAWFIVLAVPAILGAAGALGDHEDERDGTVLTWIVGYLVQFGLFFFIAKETGNLTRTSWWLVASLLPWVAYWLPLEMPWTVVPLVAATALFAWWMWRTGVGEDDLQRHGVRATGEVLEVIEPRLFNTVVNEVYIKRTLRLRVVRDDGAAPYETTWKSLFMLGDIPGPGDRLRFRIDPKRPQRLAAERDAAPSSGRRATRGRSAERGDVEARLRHLSDLHEKGLVTDEEYKAQRKAIVREI